MAIPVLYWMLECTSCGARRVVYDRYLVFEGSAKPNPDDDDGYVGPPLPERHSCAKGCTGPLRAVGSLFEPDEEIMWLFDPHVPFQLTRSQSEEWQRLIREPGYSGSTGVNFGPPLDHP